MTTIADLIRFTDEQICEMFKVPMRLLRVQPRCWNRPPFRAYSLVRNGVCPRTGKPRYRVAYKWFEDRCATWDGVGIGPNGERYPVAHNFDCRGCRWLPAERVNDLS